LTFKKDYSLMGIWRRWVVREKNTDEFGNTMSYVFLGHVYYIEHYGSKPMSIKWGLQVPIPPYIWKETAKMAVG
jgi:hypothetical protein